jgi:hypothetical protein
MTAEEFNEQYGIGTSVNYHPVIGEVEHQKTRTRSEAWSLWSGEPVIKVNGIVGCVSLHAISIDPMVAEYARLGRTIEKCPINCTCANCAAFMKTGDEVHRLGLMA